MRFGQSRKDDEAKSPVDVSIESKRKVFGGSNELGETLSSQSGLLNMGYGVVLCMLMKSCSTFGQFSRLEIVASFKHGTSLV